MPFFVGKNTGIRRVSGRGFHFWQPSDGPGPDSIFGLADSFSFAEIISRNHKEYINPTRRQKKSNIVAEKAWVLGVLAYELDDWSEASYQQEYYHDPEIHVSRSDQGERLFVPTPREIIV